MTDIRSPWSSHATRRDGWRDVVNSEGRCIAQVHESVAPAVAALPRLLRALRAVAECVDVDGKEQLGDVSPLLTELADIELPEVE